MYPRSSYASLVDMMERAVQRHPGRQAIGSRTGGTWTWTSYAELGRAVDNLRAALAGLGVTSGDRLAIVSDNRVEWAVSAFAAYGLGAAVVPMYEAQPPSEWEFIARDSGAVVLMAASSAIAERCLSFQSRTALRHVVTFDATRAATGSYQGLIARADGQRVAPVFPDPEDLAAILYTSGTTGEPKGTRLSHRSVATNVSAIHTLLPLSSADRALSCLPWAHAFGFTCELHGLLSLGASVALVESADKMFECLSEVQPTLIIGVPRLFQQLYERIQRLVDARPTLIRVPFARALELNRHPPDGARGVAARLAMAAADPLLLAPVRDRLGGRLRWAFSGGAALGRDVAEFFDALGIPLYEGYGLTETGPVVTTNHPGAQRFGSVGRPLPGVTLRIEPSVGDDSAPASASTEHHAPPSNGTRGEVIVHGPSLMAGYHGRPADDAAVFVTDPTTGARGLRTGDLGFLDRDGFLHITGRLKEQYKLANGKYVAPSPIEEAMKRSPLITNAMLFGENRDYNVALIVPNIDALAGWASDAGLTFDSTAELLASPSACARILEDIDGRSQQFRPFERVRKVALVEQAFSVDSRLLTPSLKIRRNAILDRYRDRLEALYRAL